MFLKVAPDLETGEVETIVETSFAHGLAGIMVSNTTISRPPLKSRSRDEAGGLSGAPLTALSTRVLGEFAQASAGRLILVGVGGIGSGAEAYAKIRAGASAVQLYSALVFEGPGLVTRIKRDLAARLRAEGFTSVAQAIGAV
jgi:dihydroorotate dehydrogenase